MWSWSERAWTTRKETFGQPAWRRYRWWQRDTLCVWVNRASVLKGGLPPARISVLVLWAYKHERQADFWTSGSVNLILISVKEYKPRLTLHYTQISLWTFCTDVQSFLLFQRTIDFGINNSLLQRVCSYGCQDGLYFHNWNHTWLLQHPQRGWDSLIFFLFSYYFV